MPFVYSSKSASTQRAGRGFFFDAAAGRGGRPVLHTVSERLIFSNILISTYGDTCYV